MKQYKVVAEKFPCAHALLTTAGWGFHQARLGISPDGRGVRRPCPGALGEHRRAERDETQAGAESGGILLKRREDKLFIPSCALHVEFSPTPVGKSPKRDQFPGFAIRPLNNIPLLFHLVNFTQKSMALAGLVLALMEDKDHGGVRNRGGRRGRRPCLPWGIDGMYREYFRGPRAIQNLITTNLDGLAKTQNTEHPPL